MRKRAMMLVPLAVGARRFFTPERREAIRQSLEKVPKKVPDRVGPVVIREQKRSRKRGTLLLTLGAAVGAALAYFFDRQQGRARRAKARDMTVARFRRTRDEMQTFQTRAENKLEGIKHELTPQRGDTDPPNDPTLQHKIESEVLGNYPTGSILVNAEDGRVVLRGVLEHPADIRRLEDDVRKIPGVRDVENLVHLKGTDARR